MTQAKLNHYKQLLLDKKHQIMQEIEAVSVDKGESVLYTPNDQYVSQDNEEDAQDIENYDRARVMENTLEANLNKVERALMRIDQGTYGKDIYTGEEIPEERLEVLPEAETVVK